MKPRILFYDLEVAPNLAYVWGMYEQNVIQVEQEKVILSLAWKWHGDSKVHQMSFDAAAYSDAKIVAKLKSLLDEAHIAVGHNIDKYDRRISNGRMLLNGVKPPSHYRTVDTLKVARKHFALNSNRLDDLARLLKVGRKKDTGGFKLWHQSMHGVKSAMFRMGLYNMRDVRILERVYTALLPWIDNHPNVGTITGDKTACPNCGSQRSRSKGFRFTNTGEYQRRICLKCSSPFKGAKVAA